MKTVLLIQRSSGEVLDREKLGVDISAGATELLLLCLRDDGEGEQLCSKVSDRIHGSSGHKQLLAQVSSCVNNLIRGIFED